MSVELPFLKKQALELLKVDYPDQKTAAAKIPVALAEYYRTAYPEIYKQKRAQVDTAGEVVKAIYLRNVFPEMKITWGTHPNNIGHEEAGLLPLPRRQSHRHGRPHHQGRLVTPATRSWRRTRRTRRSSMDSGMK